MVSILVGILNTLAITAVLGLVIYTKIIYTRPIPKELQERIALKKALDEETEKRAKFVPHYVDLAAFQGNISPSTLPSGGKKEHVVQFKLNVEIVDQSYVDLLQAKKDVFLDQIQTELNSWNAEKLATTQGRYILRDQMRGILNELLRTKPNEPNIVNQVYFTDFMVQ